MAGDKWTLSKQQNAVVFDVTILDNISIYFSSSPSSMANTSSQPGWPGYMVGHRHSTTLIVSRQCAKSFAENIFYNIKHKIISQILSGSCVFVCIQAYFAYINWPLPKNNLIWLPELLLLLLLVVVVLPLLIISKKLGLRFDTFAGKTFNYWISFQCLYFSPIYYPTYPPFSHIFDLTMSKLN